MKADKSEPPPVFPSRAAQHDSGRPYWRVPDGPQFVDVVLYGDGAPPLVWGEQAESSGNLDLAKSIRAEAREILGRTASAAGE